VLARRIIESMIRLAPQEAGQYYADGILPQKP